MIIRHFFSDDGFQFIMTFVKIVKQYKMVKATAFKNCGNDPNRDFVASLRINCVCKWCHDKIVIGAEKQFDSPE